MIDMPAWDCELPPCHLIHSLFVLNKSPWTLHLDRHAFAEIQVFRLLMRPLQFLHVADRTQYLFCLRMSSGLNFPKLISGGGGCRRIYFTSHSFRRVVLTRFGMTNSPGFKYFTHGSFIIKLWLRPPFLGSMFFPSRGIYLFQTVSAVL